MKKSMGLVILCLGMGILLYLVYSMNKNTKYDGGKSSVTDAQVASSTKAMTDYIDITKVSKSKKNRICWAFDYWPPYHSFNKKDDIYMAKPEGFLVDLIVNIIVHYNHKTNKDLIIDYRQRPWKRAQHEVRKGSCDFFVTALTTEREEYSLAIKEPVFYLENKIFKSREFIENSKEKESAMANLEGEWMLNKDSKKILQVLAKQRTLMGVTFLGDGWWKQNLSSIPTHHVNQPHLVFKALFEKRADFAITSTQEASYMLKDKVANAKKQIIDTGIIVESTPMYLMLSKKSSYKNISSDLLAVIKSLNNTVK